MKASLFVLFFAASVFAQSPADRLTAACGPEKTGLKVKLDDAAHDAAPPPPEGAQLVFIHDSGRDTTTPVLAYPTTRYGVDGAWVGAGHGNSWSAVNVVPGEHHLCAALQSIFFATNVQLAHLTAVAGTTYYFRTRLIMSRSVELLELDQIDSDQGKLLISIYPKATGTLKR
jgi:hypothetical protein